MLRVSSSNVLVVPPFECAWLTGPEFQLQDGSGCLRFEVKGDNDVTIIFKRTAGAKRWQPLQLQNVQNGDGSRTGDGTLAVEQNYTVIMGSHRNSRLKIEKNGTTQLLVENVGGSRVNSRDFSEYWIDYCNGTITIGTGTPGENVACQWKDADPMIDYIQHVGLSCWDKHVSYRNIQLLPSVQPSRGERASQRGGPPSLTQLAVNQLVNSLGACSACVTLAVADYLLPTTSSLYIAALKYLAEGFQDVLTADPESFTILPCHALADLLAHPSLAVGEKLLFDLLVAWAASGQRGPPCSMAARQEHELQQLLPLIRFPQMTLAELQEVSQAPFTAQQPMVRELLEEAFQAHSDDPSAPQTADQKTLFAVESRRLVALREAGRTSSAVRLQRRLPPSCRELMYVHDGDKNGVVQHIATAYGQQAWVNPVLAKRLAVKASSPSARHTDPKVLVSGHFARTSFAGPRYQQGGQATTWWMLDLGPPHRLACNYYSVRQDGSQDFMRCFKLQASLDSEQWTDLRVHMNDPSVRLPGQYASWAVSGPAASTPYRYFRVVLTGPSSAAAWNLCICYLELYGYFFRDDAIAGERGG